MVSLFFEGLAKHAKRSWVYIAVGVGQTVLAFILALKSPGSLNGFAACLGAVDINLYGGGALKAWAEGKNGNGGTNGTTA